MGKLSSGLLCVPFLDRVFAALHELARLGGLLPRFSKACIWKRAETHLALTAINGEAIEP